MAFFGLASRRALAWRAPPASAARASCLAKSSLPMPGSCVFRQWPIMMYERSAAPAAGVAGGFFAEIGPISGRNHLCWFTALLLMFGAGTGG